MPSSSRLAASLAWRSSSSTSHADKPGTRCRSAVLIASALLTAVVYFFGAPCVPPGRARSPFRESRFQGVHWHRSFCSVQPQLHLDGHVFRTCGGWKFSISHPRGSGREFLILFLSVQAHQQSIPSVNWRPSRLLWMPFLVLALRRTWAGGAPIDTSSTRWSDSRELGQDVPLHPLPSSSPRSAVGRRQQYLAATRSSTSF